MNLLQHQAKRFGKNMRSYIVFLNACKENRNVEFHHTEYVVMSRERYSAMLINMEIDKRKRRVYPDVKDDVEEEIDPNVATALLIKNRKE